MANVMMMISEEQIAALEKAAQIMDTKRCPECGKVKGKLVASVRNTTGKCHIHIICKHCKKDIHLVSCIDV